MKSENLLFTPTTILSTRVIQTLNIILENGSSSPVTKFLLILEQILGFILSSSQKKTQASPCVFFRTRADKRRVVNEKEIAPILERHEQVKKCLNAEVIVGPHGAGLVNMLFMKEEGGVLEFVNKNTTISATDQWQIN